MVLSFWFVSWENLFKDKPKKQCSRKEKSYTKQEFDKTKRGNSLGETG